MSKLEYRFEFRFNRAELQAIIHSIQYQIAYLKGLFEDWYPLCNAEMESYKLKADELHLLIYLENALSDELHND